MSAEPRPDVREVVALGCRVLGLEGHGDLVWGHVAARAGDDGSAWMKAAGWAFEEVTVERTLLVGRDGAVLEGVGRRHAEYPIHTEIFAVRPEIGAVVHSHAQHAVAFAALGVPLRPLSHEGTLFSPPDVARFTETGDLILTAELGAAVARSLGDRNAVFLVHHGIVTVGVDVPAAVMTAVILERACRTQLRAMAAGLAHTWSNDDEALSKRTNCYGPTLLRAAWDYLVRRVG